MEASDKLKINVAVRACIVVDSKLLLVTNDNSYWYLPGGHQNPGESLQACIVREVYEETGYEIECEDILYCSEFIDRSLFSHKIEVIFRVKVKKNQASKWNDLDKSVTDSQFFSLKELHALNVQPRYLRQGGWLEQSSKPVYQGIESN